MNVNELLNKYENKIVIYKVGSSVIPFLQDIARDNEYAVCMLEYNYELENDLINDRKNCDFQYFINRFDSNNFCIWSYQNHYVIKYGQGKYNIYENDPLTDTEKYYLVVKNFFNKYKRNHHKKLLYYYLVDMYLLQNKSYNFTQKQIKNIRDFHNYIFDENILNELYTFFDIKIK